jgi:hypothetical protein
MLFCVRKSRVALVVFVCSQSVQVQVWLSTYGRVEVDSKLKDAGWSRQDEVSVPVTILAWRMRLKFPPHPPVRDPFIDRQVPSATPLSPPSEAEVHRASRRMGASAPSRLVFMLRPHFPEDGDPIKRSVLGPTFWDPHFGTRTHRIRCPPLLRLGLDFGTCCLSSARPKHHPGTSSDTLLSGPALDFCQYSGLRLS